MIEEKTFLRKVYSLKENPFSTGRSGVVPEHYVVGRQHQKHAWTKVVDSKKGKSASSLNFVVGDYGYGKSLTLWMILEQYKNDPEAIGAYMKLLREDLTPKFGLDFIQRIFSAIDIQQIKIKDTKKALEKLPEGLRQQASVLTQWLEGNELAKLFLLGKAPLKATDLATLGLRQKINSTEVAKEYLVAFLYALKESGRPTLLLCIDEVEYLFSQMRGAKVANVINSLRDIYDLPTSPEVARLGLSIANMIFFFGISQSGWENLNNLEKKELTQGGPIQPLFSRKERVIELTALSPQETEELIEMRLKFNRTTNTIEKEPLIPYTEDFVKYVYELTLGNPREIVERCDYTLVDGSEKRAPQLTRAFAKKVFESRGLLTEPSSVYEDVSRYQKRQRKRSLH